MTEILRIAPANATTKTAQDAPRTTIGTGGDLQVPLISGSRLVNEVFRASPSMGRFREITEGVDAAVAVNAQNAPKRLGKLQTVFHKRPHPSLFLRRRTKSDQHNQQKTLKRSRPQNLS